MRQISFLFLLIFFTLLGNAQKKFEGIITYSIEYTKIPNEMANMTSHLPSEWVVKYSDTKKKEEAISSNSSKITITDLSNNESFVLMTLFGEKIALIQDHESKKTNELYSDCQVELTKEHKKIGDFKCQKALLYFPNLKDSMEVYFTDKYTTAENKFSKLGGIPLQYSTTENGMLITYTMVKIEIIKLDTEEFEVDKSYTILTPEELQKQFGME